MHDRSAAAFGQNVLDRFLFPNFAFDRGQRLAANRSDAIQRQRTAVAETIENDVLTSIQ